MSHPRAMLYIYYLGDHMTEEVMTGHNWVG